jgi:hypothetical protein
MGRDVDRARDLIGLARQTILFLLGVAVVIDSVVTPGTHIGELAAAIVMLGLAPVDALLERISQRNPPDA